MSRLRSLFALPSRDASPTETLRWVRRMEIKGGVAALTWSNEWWSWLLVGTGVLGLTPWSGASAILRKAQTRPEILISDPERRRRRGRRALKVIVPAYAVILTAIGYVLLGWGGAVFFCVGGLVSCALGVWMYLKMEPS